MSSILTTSDYRCCFWSASGLCRCYFWCCSKDAGEIFLWLVHEGHICPSVPKSWSVLKFKSGILQLVFLGTVQEISITVILKVPKMYQFDNFPTSGNRTPLLQEWKHIYCCTQTIFWIVWPPSSPVKAGIHKEGEDWTSHSQNYSHLARQSKKPTAGIYPSQTRLPEPMTVVWCWWKSQTGYKLCKSNKVA